MSLKQSKVLPKSELERLEKLTAPERAARAKGYQCVVGVDEAGRGSLAGPVVAAACTFPEGRYFAGINDSKLLSPAKRKALFAQLVADSTVQFGIGIVENEVIDQINIFQATLQAMRLAVRNLPKEPDCLLVDGEHLFSHTIYSEALVQGDRRSQMIAAASILAKETRDQIMVELHQKYLQYGFDRHKGYGTKEHRAALEKYGPSPIHRASFYLGIPS